MKFISKGVLRPGSIDSVLTLVQGLQGLTIRKNNPCIMNGSLVTISIASGSDTTRFILNNTFDRTALKILDIINPYLPKDKPLYGSKDDLKEEEDCWTSLQDSPERSRDSTKRKH